MISTPEIRVLSLEPDKLGESPLWHPLTQELLWVDIGAFALRRIPINGGTVRSVYFDLPPSALALDEEGSILVAAGTGWHRLSDNDSLVLQTSPQGSLKGWRMNDACTDIDGRLWTGRVAYPINSGVEGCLYKLDYAGVVQVVGGMKTQNGLAVSPDGTTLYLADSHPNVNVIWAFDLDRTTGALSNRRIFHKPEKGRVDGAAIDCEGCYWFAEIDGSRITRLTPEGRIAGIIELPITRPTKLAFAGSDLKTICVTSMSIPQNNNVSTKEPLAGAVLTFESEVAGMPVPRATVLSK